MAYPSKNWNSDGLDLPLLLVTDKALIDLVNGLRVNADLIKFRKTQSSLFRLIGTINGSNRRRDNVFNENILMSQTAILDLIKEIMHHAGASDWALGITQDALLETRAALRRSQQSQVEITNKLDVLVEELNGRLGFLESRIEKVEAKSRASEELEKILAAWIAGTKYVSLPWSTQVVLLACEIFRGAVGIYEYYYSDFIFRSFVVDRILSHIGGSQPPWFGLADLMDSLWQSMSRENVLLISDILDMKNLGLAHSGSTLSIVTATLELASLPDDVRPASPGRCAIELHARKFGDINYTTDIHSFIRSVVQESTFSFEGVCKRRESEEAYL